MAFSPAISYEGYRMVNLRLRKTVRPLLQNPRPNYESQDFEIVQHAASPRSRDSRLECRDFMTGLIFSAMHHFLIYRSIPLIFLIVIILMNTYHHLVITFVFLVKIFSFLLTELDNSWFNHKESIVLDYGLHFLNKAICIKTKIKILLIYFFGSGHSIQLSALVLF